MSDTYFYDGCVDLTPAASAAVGGASGLMAAGVVEVGTGGVGLPVAAAAGAAVGAAMQDRMENGGWESTCAAMQSAWDAVTGPDTPPAAPPSPWLESPAYSPDMASIAPDPWAGSTDFSGGYGGDAGGGGSGDGGWSGDA